MNESPNTDSPDTDTWSLGTLALQTIVLLAVVGTVVVLLGLWLREPLTALATSALETFGFAGLFVGVVATDAFSFPVPQSAYFVVTIAAESSPVAVVSVTSAASLIGGAVAYHIGPFVTRIPLLGRRLEKLRTRTEGFFKRWGLWAVALVAVTPLPFPIGCWLAGIYRIPFWRFFGVILLRIPRFAVYYSLFMIGWASTAPV